MSRPDLSLGDTRLIIETAEKSGVLRSQLAYILATAFWETAHTMEPVKEAFWLSESWRKNNLRYYPWYGRGYVQLTWEQNYRRAGKELGLDLTTDAEKVMEPSVSARILVTGMLEGWFTGRKLADYINGTKADFVGARRIVNGTDKARAIAQIASDYLVVLNELGLGEGPDLVDVDRPTLHIGMVNTAREDVRRYQIDLANLGYHVGAADGRYGSRTRGRTLEFEADHGIAQDGVVGADNWEKLERAKPKPKRAHTEQTLREAGSQQIAQGDQGEREATWFGSAISGSATLEFGKEALRELSTSGATLTAAQNVIVENWIILGLIGAGIVVVFRGKKIMKAIKSRRVFEAVTGRNVGT